jgi:hypothetical protein
MARHGQKQRTQPKPQEQQKHPNRWQKDLNPKRLQGQNVGPHRAEDINPRTADNIKELTRTLAELSTDELKDIPIVPTGTRLEQGAVYLDLRNPARGPFQATAEMFASEENLHAPKAEIPYELWNRLVSILCPDVKHRSATAESAEHRESRNAGVSEQMIDKAIADSFPTSDPPSWTTGREKEPEHSDGEKGQKRK